MALLVNYFKNAVFFAKGFVRRCTVWWIILIGTRAKKHAN